MRASWMLGIAALALCQCTSNAIAQYPMGYDSFGPSSYPFPTVNTAQNQTLSQGQVYQVQGYSPQATVANPYQFTTAQSGVYGGANAGGALPQVDPNFAVPSPTPAPSSGINGGMQAAEMVPQGPIVQSSPAMQAPHVHNAPMVQAPAVHAPTMHAPTVHSPMVHSHQGGGSCPSCGTNAVANPGTVISGAAPAYGYATPMAPNAANCGTAPVSGGYYPSSCYPVSTPAYPTMRTMITPRSWFFGGGALLFNRIENKAKPLSFYDSSYLPDVLTTLDARQRAAAGFEATIGRYFNCGRNALSFTYWGIFPEDQMATRSSASAGLYRSRIPYSYMTMAGTPSAPMTPYSVYDWYDNAYTHYLARSFEYHNVEINLLGFAVGGAARNFNMTSSRSIFRSSCNTGCGYCGGSGCGSCASQCGSGCGGSCGGSCGNTCNRMATTGPCNLIAPTCGSRCNLTWLAGFRYFRFRDNLLYASSLADTMVNRAADDLYYEVNTTNDLIGFQTGCRLDVCLGKRFNGYTNIRAGVYNNRSTLYTRLGTDYDYAYLNDTRMPTNPDNGRDYMFDVTKNNVAFLGELGTGFGARLTCHWTGTFGYRVVVASGVANAADNVRNSFAHYQEIVDFDNCGVLFLHGFQFGAQYNF